MTFILWTILIGALINLLIAVRFYYFVRYAPAPELPVEEQENAVVILSVRGCDPTLETTVTGLLNQNFRDYQIVVVVDSQSDPAWTLLQRIKYEADPHDRLNIQEMDSPRTTCSLKCNSIVGVVEGLPASTRWLAFVDADVAVYPNWLTDLLGPLTNVKVSVSTGNQWFEPNNRQSSGSLIRSIWNAGAIVPSVLLSHPWAGSMGIRYEDVVVSTLIDDWKTSIVDDGPMTRFAAQMNGRVVVNPKLLMVNREDCSQAFAVSWINRMLTWSRIYESTFWITMIHATISGGVVLCLALWALGALLTLNLIPMVFVIATFVIAASMLTAGYWIVRKSVSASLLRRELRSLDSPTPITPKELVRIGMLMAPVQLLYLLGCLKAKIATTIVWRGIEYRISDDEVEMTKYQPFESPIAGKSTESI